MEQRAKLAAVCLGICFIFVAFPCISSTRVYNPEYFIERITALLTKLAEEPSIKKSSYFRVEGPTTADWENNEKCEGSFMDIFENGTQKISHHFQHNQIIGNISKSIHKCVKQLENDCPNLKKDHYEECKSEIKRQTVIHFVEGFLRFSNAFPISKMCNKMLKLKYDRFADNRNETLPIC